MNNIYLKGDTFSITTNPQNIALESCMQEVALWQGENPMSEDMGIDYFGVMEGFVYLKTSIEAITEKYRGSFVDIVVGDPNYSEAEEKLSISIEFYLEEGKIELKEIGLSLR